ncbi:MAG: uncharacterized protein conserved in archaea [halophilic archaeon J07HX5]|nr:MAG: uncharacterized protein conserved in archaea [halophilic archaeon J07HX5]
MARSTRLTVQLIPPGYGVCVSKRICDPPNMLKHDFAEVERQMSEPSPDQPTVGGNTDALLGVDRSDLLGFGALVALWLITIVGGMTLADEAAAAGVVLFEDPSNATNVGLFAVYVLIGTAALLLGFRYANIVHLRAIGALIFGLFIGTSAAVATGVGSVARTGTLTGLPTSPIPIAVGVVAAVVLFVYPEWYVNNIAAVVLGVGFIPMFGLGFGPFPIVLLLVVWAGYDAYSVYVSGHMKELAAGAGDLKLPMLFVVPHSLSYSMAETGFDVGIDDTDEDATAESSTQTESPGAPDATAADATDAGGTTEN